VATVFFAWELGTGLGHVTQIAPLANALVRRGHTVYAALRELKSANGFFDAGVHLLGAPHLGRALRSPRPTRSFADILADLTFGDDNVLAAHARAWRSLYRLARPHVMVFDHSPTALLASRGAPARRVVLGNGFIAPPGISPFPPLRPLPDAQRLDLTTLEAQLLARVNQSLCGWRQQPLESPAQLYSQVDQTLLTTFAELDPYVGLRPADTTYLGPVNASGGHPPQWPDGAGKKVYAYLSPFPALPALLRFLAGRQAPTVAFIPGMDERSRRRFSSPTLRLESKPLDVRRAARECDAAVLNGNGGTAAAAVLLAGRPSLHFPLYFEHAVNARCVERLGAGRSCAPGDPSKAVENLRDFLGSDAYTVGAEAFARRYAAFDANRQHEEMLGALLKVIEKGQPGG